jgi:transcriptional regulator with XRE-family HTH domain
MHSRPEQLFGERLRELRLARGLTQEQLAERAHIHRTYLASVESGKRNVAIVNVIYLSRALDVSPGELFSEFTPEVLRALPPNTRNQTRARREK